MKWSVTVASGAKVMMTPLTFARSAASIEPIAGGPRSRDEWFRVRLGREGLDVWNADERTSRRSRRAARHNQHHDSTVFALPIPVGARRMPVDGSVWASGGRIDRCPY